MGGHYILRRLLQSIPVLFLASVAIFLMLRLIPGDPAIVILGSDARPEQIEAVREDLHLDDPLPVQYVSWLGHVLQGDLGYSYGSQLSSFRADHRQTAGHFAIDRGRLRAWPC